ncbi:MAG: isoprenyl transferase [Myxococcota bacterium]
MGSMVYTAPPRVRPSHVAIIMDGNGRWAGARDLARIEGHRRGADVVRDITTFARELEISYLTLYSFSAQNWCRPVEEVAGLMQLLEEYCDTERDTLMKNNIRLATIGELERLPPSTRYAVESLKRDTAANTMMTLTLAIDYGSREEMVIAVKRLLRDVASGQQSVDAVNESTLRQYFYAPQMPDPDLVIRTSGEQRISNFLLWQIAYAELCFSEVLWPDFNREHFVAALHAFARRQRRYGATQEQIDAALPSQVGFTAARVTGVGG